jgi:hypothetical protein
MACILKSFYGNTFDMETNIANKKAVNDLPIELLDQDFILRNECTHCVHQFELTRPSEHELCSFVGKCRDCGIYINPYQVH